eukprot:TRINITY_DN1765_c1_g2_i1.p1 TRINITY_DN1765_c1_g2~~TRINITY_DN1765_c1_g2_i1.p1  ORF type:complete len:398 (-),score=88.58 TRINITY_DN1765_c1_g2_i1:135-1328(-)
MMIGMPGHVPPPGMHAQIPGMPGMPGMPQMMVPMGAPGMPMQMAPQMMTAPAPMMAQMATGMAPPGMMPMVAPGLAPAPVPQPAQRPPAIVSIALDNIGFRYQLQEADIRETFERWGTVQNVQVIRDAPRELAIVTMADQVDAQDAQRQLSGATCSFEGVSGQLIVMLGGPEAILRMPPPVIRPAPLPPPAGAPGVPLPPPGSSMAKQLPNGSGKGDGKGVGFPPPVASAPPRPVWCCKIVVEAQDLHPEFPTVSRIAGENGANLDHIKSQTKCFVQIRGKGSETLEPETNQELNEPLFLWMKSDDPANGKAALEMTQDLLHSIYDGHKQWCEQNNLVHPEYIKPKIFENPDILPGVTQSAPNAPPAPAPAPGRPAPGPYGKAPGFVHGKASGSGPY